MNPWKMLRALRAKTAVRLRISLNVRFQGNKERTYSVSANREEGYWVLDPPETVLVIVPESSQALAEKLRCLQMSARDYAEKNAPRFAWDEIEERIDEFLKGGGTGEQAERTPDAVKAIAQYGYEAHVGAPLLAATFSLEGFEALRTHDLYKAACCLEHGRRWMSPDMLIADPRKPFRERAKTGGVAKAGRSEPVKQALQRFLIELQPEEGWAKKSDAVKEVATMLRSKELPLVESCKLKAENLDTRFAEWMLAEPERFRYRLRPKR